MAAIIAFIIAGQSDLPLVATANSSSVGLTSKVIVTERRGGMTSISPSSLSPLAPRGDNPSSVEFGDVWRRNVPSATSAGSFPKRLAGVAGLKTPHVDMGANRFERVACIRRGAPQL